MMLYLMAVNLDRVLFTDIIELIEYPDYNWEAEPQDEENAVLNQYHEVPQPAEVPLTTPSKLTKTTLLNKRVLKG